MSAFKNINGAGNGGVRMSAPAATKPEKKETPPELTEVGFMESMQDDSSMENMLEAMDSVDAANIRAEAVAAVIVFAESEDIGYDYFESLAIGLADLDGDEEIDSDEADLFNEILSTMAEAAIALGVKSELVKAMIDDEDDDAAESVYFALRKALKNADKSEDEIIAGFVVAEDSMLEAKRKVIRNNKVTFVKKRTKKKRLSSAQRQGLKKARKKAHSSSAKKKRRKSRNMRKARGM